MATTAISITETCVRAKRAAPALATSSTEVRRGILRDLAARLRDRVEEIHEANGADLADERTSQLTPALIDRLTLSPDRIETMATGVEAILELDDPVGELLEERTLASGIEMRKIRVPLGVIAVVYEARPNVTIDCAALCIGSGNALVLRGSSYAARSNGVLAQIVREAIAAAGLPEDLVALAGTGERTELAELATQEDVVDLIIPRGGEGLKHALKSVATVPVVYAASGNCHVYVHEDADLEMARRIVYDAKVDRPGVCNSAETLLVHESVIDAFLERALVAMSEAGVELVGDEAARRAVPTVAIGEAGEADWADEYLALKMAVRVVGSLDEAINHVNRYGSGHSEAIVTGSQQAGDRFTAEVDAACTYVNASTRFTDGFEFGLGAEIANSTQKLHARGPFGMRELTTYKYVLHGNGQIRGRHDI